jgi:hypothetical protein
MYCKLAASISGCWSLVALQTTACAANCMQWVMGFGGFNLPNLIMYKRNELLGAAYAARTSPTASHLAHAMLMHGGTMKHCV